ncbi:MAG: hypothetical protein PHD67_02140 [Oscillospiraceae bacterium]|nr:hypothetical protein [Oscillospiraceae bacterium]
MLQSFFWVAAALLAAIGAVHVVCALTAAALEPRERTRSLLVIPLDPRVENVEQVIRHARFVLGQRPSGCRLVLLDLGMEEEAREICRRFCREAPELLLEDEEGFLRLLQSQKGGAAEKK